MFAAGWILSTNNFCKYKAFERWLQNIQYNEENEQFELQSHKGQNLKSRQKIINNRSYLLIYIVAITKRLTLLHCVLIETKHIYMQLYTRE